jgi:hypothetical protein
MDVNLPQRSIRRKNVMTKLEQMEQLAYDERIALHNYRISEDKPGVIFVVDGCAHVALDESALRIGAERCVTLAEEIGHLVTGALYLAEATANLPSGKANRCKAEYHARVWSYKLLLPPALVREALKRNAGCPWYEVADYCNVTIDFLNAAIEHYRTMGVVFDCTEV